MSITPWKWSRYIETCRSYDKSCVKIYIILTLMHLLVLLSELFNTAYLLSGYLQFESRPAGALTILGFSWFSSKFIGECWNRTTTSYQFTVHKAVSSIRSAPRAFQITPTNQPHTTSKLLQIVTSHQKLNRFLWTWFRKKRGNSRLSGRLLVS